MIYRILFALHDVLPGFNVFRYITFRAALAACTALILSLLIGPWMIRRLKEFQIGQSIRAEGPETHQSKKGTPTMGGVLILLSILVATSFWADLTNPLVLVALASTAAFGLIGFVDDWQKLAKQRSLGLTARRKFALQVAVAAGIGLVLVHLAGEGAHDLRLSLPFLKSFHPDLGAWYMPFAILVIVGSANAVNLTDGLDGLAIGATSVSFATYALIAYLVGHVKAADYLGVPFVANGGELAVFGAAVLGASLGFLWFNCPPAQVFMGDTGSMGLGGAIGTMALCIKQEMLLIIVGGVFVLEAASVMVQVSSFKLTGKRVFKMTPLHHHFEAHRTGWPSYIEGRNWAESKVVIRFWILAILFALVGLSTLKLR